MKDSISTTMVDLLQDIRESDPQAFAKLVTWSTPINIEPGKHPVLQVSPGRGKAQLTLIGLLNSVLIAAGDRKIGAVMDNDTVVGFTLLETNHRVGSGTTAPPSPPLPPGT